MHNNRILLMSISSMVVNVKQLIIITTYFIVIYLDFGHLYVLAQSFLYSSLSASLPEHFSQNIEYIKSNLNKVVVACKPNKKNFLLSFISTMSTTFNPDKSNPKVVLHISILCYIVKNKNTNIIWHYSPAMRFRPLCFLRNFRVKIWLNLCSP